MDKKSILIVGAGGIGSYLAEHLHNLIKNKQISASVTIADDDTVDTKNLIGDYQNYDEFDLFEGKSDVIAHRYDFQSIDKRVTNADTFRTYDIIISAVDNSQFRAMLYRADPAYWIDLRSTGRTVAFFTKNKKNSVSELLTTLDLDNKEGQSCQYNWQLSTSNIELGNRIIAQIGAQLVLNHCRGEINSRKYIYNF